MSEMTDEDKKQQIKKTIETKDIEFIRLQFTDIFGMSKSVAITTDELDKALEGELMFDGSSVDGFGRVDESDMYLVPDLNTFTTVPWRPGASNASTANIYCDVYGTDFKPFKGCPRNILKKAIQEANDMGYEFAVGPEGEFFLFNLDEDGELTMDIHDHAGYFDLSPVDRGEDARKDIILTMKKYGFSIEASHHEVAPGQHEIDFRYDEALKTADMWMSFKQIVKNIAQSYNLYASFIPKPFPDQNANAMHCNQSLSIDGKNAFYDPDDPIQLSDIARYYIGGLMKHAKGMAAIANPTVNSYKRLMPGYEAPTNIAWSCLNRSSFIRIPASRGEGTRIELRTPDPTANPYLIFAVMLRAGLEGIRNKIEPPAEYASSVYGMTSEDMEKENIECYPSSLEEALEYMRQDDLVRETLGDHSFWIYYNAKLKEWNEYAREVHDWEFRKYLKKY